MCRLFAFLAALAVAAVSYAAPCADAGVPDQLTTHGHFGLVGMRERVELIGGAFAVESAPGKGTVVRVTWTAQS